MESSNTLLGPAPLGPSGRPIMMNGEVELKSEFGGIHVYEQDGRAISKELFPGCSESSAGV